MGVKVMLVEDSALVRGMITRALNATADIRVVANAMDGAVAIPMAREYQPDIIVLDIEMPEMDGITALPKLLEAAPHAQVIMASTLTLRGASISLKALELGAVDYITKPTAGTPEELKDFYRELADKVHALADRRKSPVRQPQPYAATIIPAAKAPASLPIKALAIASSTGGPQALLQLFSDIKGKLSHVPIFLTQHMPETFTAVLAQHLSKAGDRTCTEAKDGDEVMPGHVYVAPGNHHMLAVLKDNKIVIHINQEPPVHFCRPSANPMFASLSRIYGKSLLAAVLTGMGQDGLEGAKVIVKSGGSVIAQDEETSIVWGMPKAVAVNNLCQAVLPLSDISAYLLQHVG